MTQEKLNVVDALSHKSASLIVFMVLMEWQLLEQVAELMLSSELKAINYVSDFESLVGFSIWY